MFGSRRTRSARSSSNSKRRVTRTASSRSTRSSSRTSSRAGAPGKPDARRSGKDYAESRMKAFRAKRAEKKEASAEKGRKRDAAAKKSRLQALRDQKKYGSVRTTRLGKLKKTTEDAKNKRRGNPIPLSKRRADMRKKAMQKLRQRKSRK